MQPQHTPLATRLAHQKSPAHCFQDHGRFLEEFGSSGNPNFQSMQYWGLATVALTLPELTNASKWLTGATDGVKQDMHHGVYPDGVETEQTSGYHYVATRCFDG
eukprot:m.111978 g.111978  ORF g.111978 m.111978 type:complete len:104 (-) comp16149_c0_seq3:229-540(-)